MSDDDEHQDPSNQRFVPVCSIGASAGGVTALQGLFRLLPTNLGLAYVVILHLSPDQPSALSEILAGCTRMPVVLIQDAPTLKPDCVFVIPPDRELVIKGDSVTARPFSEPRGRRAPIDMFFRSIAAARGDGVAIVLSGAGADGAVGVRAVKEAGGVIMVQEPADAAFPSMPQNAIATGVADFVAPLPRLAERLAEVAHSKEAVRSLDADGSANDLRRIVAFLRARTGHDFSSYKRATVMRRVIRRMQVCRTDTLARYADYLSTTPEEAKELFSDLLISVTMFFRDAHAFEALERHAIKPLFDDLDPEKEETIRAWVVGCATGEEAYSLAMLLHEEAARRKRTVAFQIFASDLDEGALATAREGRYPRSIEADVSDERLARFFVDEGLHYRVRKELRESVLFATHSVLKEPPFMRLDIITCRNLLIYLERSLQQQLCAIFHYGLKPGRCLFLGSAETADSAAELFAPLDREARIYCARPQAIHLLPVLPPFAAPERLVAPDLPALGRAERMDVPAALHGAALERTAPPSVLVDGSQNIVHLSPSAGRFVLHSAGPISNLLPAVVRPELRLDLRLALTRALDGREPTLTHPVAVVLDGARRRVSMHVAPVPNGTHMGAQALVLFLEGGVVPEDEDTEPTHDVRPDEVRRLHAELKAAQDALVASRNGHEAAIQDLRATNEELQSINEEYRSTAEELETSKEELQSINEELHTVNAELKSKLASISVAHSDLQNLTDATEIGTLFLNADLRIKMFTPPITDLFNITTTDVGRSITDFSHRLAYEGIDDDARRVLRHLTPVEREVHSRAERSYVMRLRPYRTIDDRIDGVVVTFFDITDRLQAEAALRESEARLSAMFEVLPVGVGISDTTGRLILTNPEMRRFLPSGLVPSREEARNWRWRALDEQGHPLDLHDFPGARALRGETVVPSIEMLYAQDDGRELWTQVAALPIRDGQNRITGHVSVVADIDASKRATEALRASEERFRAMADTAPVLIWEMDENGLVFVNGHYLNFFGVGLDEVRGGGWMRFLHPDDAEGYTAAYQAAFAERRAYVYEARFRRADGQYRWLRNSGGPMGTRGLVGCSLDVTDLLEAQFALRESEERLREFGDASSDVLWIRDAETFQWTYLTPAFDMIYGIDRATALSGDNMAGWVELIEPEDREQAVDNLRRVREGERVVFEYRVRRSVDGEIRWLRNTDFPMRDAAGVLRSIGGIGRDITDEKETADRMGVLVAELQHRTRNLIAIVRSIFGQTMRASDTLESFETQFSERLAALARVQGLLSQADQNRITIGALLRTELDALGAQETTNRITLSGPEVPLRNSVIQTLAMAFHELATNARKYGALAAQDGRLDVAWRVYDGTRDRQRLALTWDESGVDMEREHDSPVTRPGGYGRELIERALPYALGAKTSYELGAGGVRCVIDLPLDGQPAEMS